MEGIHVERNSVATIIAATYPEYRGNKVQIRAAESVTLQDLNWSGGTRSQYRACTLQGQSLGNASRFNAQHPDSNQGEGQTLPIPVGTAVVEHSMFCGKDSGLRIYVNPADMPRYLSAPAEELTPIQCEVIRAISSYKSSYGGRNRYQMARDDYQWGQKKALGETYPSLAEYESAKAELIAAGYLNKAGALTLKGKNARPARL